MNTNVITSEERFAKNEARRVVRKADEMKKAKRRYFFIQKLCGLFLAIIAIAVPYILKGDTAAFLVFLPLGLYLIFTREMVMNW